MANRPTGSPDTSDSAAPGQSEPRADDGTLAAVDEALGDPVAGEALVKGYVQRDGE